MAITKDGQPITDLKTWEEVAGPKSPSQWVEGRSAMEAARFWLAASGELPEPLAQPLQLHPDFGPPSGWSGEPEVRLSFDRRRGEPRNTDLLIKCRDEFGDYLLAVEAKADESFGETVAEALSAGLERRLSNNRSRAFERIRDLAQALLPASAAGLPPVEALRYQLLTATAGAVAEAERLGMDRVVVVIQEFITEKTRDARHQANRKDLDNFINRLSGGSRKAIVTGEVVGPLAIRGAPLISKTPRLYFLKITCGQRKVPI